MEEEEDRASGPDLSGSTDPRDQELWNLVALIFTLPEDFEDQEMYWRDVEQGMCLLLGALLILANEFDALDDTNGKNLRRPALVKKIVRLTVTHADEIRAHVSRALLGQAMAAWWLED